MSKFPSRKQLKALKASGWKRSAEGLAWQDPKDRYYYSPQAAVNRMAIRERNSEPARAESGQDSDDNSPESN